MAREASPMHSRYKTFGKSEKISFFSCVRKAFKLMENEIAIVRYSAVPFEEMGLAFGLGGFKYPPKITIFFTCVNGTGIGISLSTNDQKDADELLTIVKKSIVSYKYDTEIKESKYQGYCKNVIHILKEPDRPYEFVFNGTVSTLVPDVSELFSED